MTLDLVQLFAVFALGLLVGYFAGCARAAYVEIRREWESEFE